MMQTTWRPRGSRLGMFALLLSACHGASPNAASTEAPITAAEPNAPPAIVLPSEAAIRRGADPAPPPEARRSTAAPLEVDGMLLPPEPEPEPDLEPAAPTPGPEPEEGDGCELAGPLLDISSACAGEAALTPANDWAGYYARIAAIALEDVAERGFDPYFEAWVVHILGPDWTPLHGPELGADSSGVVHAYGDFHAEYRPNPGLGQCTLYGARRPTKVCAGEGR